MLKTTRRRTGMHLILEAEVHVRTGSEVGQVVHRVAVVAARVASHGAHSVVHGAHVLLEH